MYFFSQISSPFVFKLLLHRPFFRWRSWLADFLLVFSEPLFCTGRGGGGGGTPGVKGAGSLRQAGEERAGNGIPKVVKTRNRKNCAIFCNKKAQRGRNRNRRGGNRAYKVQGAVQMPLSSPCSHLTRNTCDGCQSLHLRHSWATWIGTD